MGRPSRPAGTTIDINPDVEFGFQIGGSYDTSWREIERASRNFQFPEERIDTERESTRNVKAHGNLNLGMNYLDEHRIDTTTL